VALGGPIRDGGPMLTQRADTALALHAAEAVLGARSAPPR
jgi:hypothetical protein